MDAIQASLDCSDLKNPMGERSKEALRVDFQAEVMVKECHKIANQLPNSYFWNYCG